MLQVVMFQNVFMDFEIWKEKLFKFFFQCLLKSLCPFKKNLGIFVSFDFHTHVNM